MTLAALAPEWRRIELLCDILQASRVAGRDAEPLLAGLQDAQRAVEEGRAQGAWSGVIDSVLSPLELDILAAVIAPVAAPGVAFAYQSITGDRDSARPGPVLVQALYSLEGDDIVAFNRALAADAPLRSRGWVSVDPGTAGPRLTVGPLLRETVFAAHDVDPLPGAREVTRPADWNDLVLNSDGRRHLSEFVSFVEGARTVVDDWGGRRRGGPIALFAGPSGTGKTLAASVLANQIGYRLFRIDLAALVSKYIGETEKNLNTLFDAAEGRRAVLLFDEADSLFAKRGEVKEARDRYANMEVSHLLSRIENQSCPCILTTNLRDHLDAAFQRRFQVVVDFPFPNAADRRRLWALHLPPKAPLKDIDIEVLAQGAALSGAGIENAALHGAHMAAAAGDPIRMRHLALGILRELAKDDMAVAIEDLGPLAAFLEEDHAVNRSADPAAAA
jgi:AAA+ superfamily predicted ATPase